MTKKTKNQQSRSGFKTPDGYFDHFQVKLSENESNQARFEEVEASGFKVPENYFEEFTVDLSENTEKSGRVISLFSRKNILRLGGVAAIFILGLFLFENSSQPVTNVANNVIDQSDIEDYIDNNDIDFYTLDFSYFTKNENNSAENLKTELNQIDQKTLLNYLSENSEVTTLLNE